MVEVNGMAPLWHDPNTTRRQYRLGNYHAERTHQLSFSAQVHGRTLIQRGRTLIWRGLGSQIPGSYLGFEGPVGL